MKLEINSEDIKLAITAIEFTLDTEASKAMPNHQLIGKLFTLVSKLNRRVDSAGVEAKGTP